MPRIGYQRGSAVDNWRRIIACYLPAGHFCSDTVSYFVASKYDMHATLALFNSSACEWRFNLTSTNNHVNAYEVDSLPVPKFELLRRASRHDVEWSRWEKHLSTEAADVETWESEVRALIMHTSSDTEYWPSAIHDALAAAGREMCRLGEDMQRTSGDFFDWIVNQLEVDEDRFSGATYLRGAQACFDQQSWDWFLDLMRRNRRCCGIDPHTNSSVLKEKFVESSSALGRLRKSFEGLDKAIDRAVWTLLGIVPE